MKKKAEMKMLEYIFYSGRKISENKMNAVLDRRKQLEKDIETIEDALKNWKEVITILPLRGDKKQIHMNGLQKELDVLKQIMNSDNPTKDAEFQKKVDEINKLYPSESDGNLIADFVMQCYEKIGDELNQVKNELTVRQQLADISGFISLSYIAKNYFGKSKQWLNNKINGCIVNGKPSKFTEDEKKRLNHALNDLSKKLGSIRIS